ncbi:MAG: caspase family protein [Gallionella sp.]|nr:caspase family protein [Gallionella sp.]
MKAKLLLLWGILLLVANAVYAKPVALLIGINEYQNVGQLEGAVSDVRSMQKTLIDRWNFKAADIKTLTNQEATYANILHELAALKQRSAEGDFVLVYFSGHGTSALDSHVNLPLPYSSGAFIPVDSPSPDQLGDLARQNRLSDVLIIGQTHLRPVLLELEKTRQIMVIADSCYSGNMVRAITPGRKAHFRQVPINFASDAMMQNSSTVRPQKAAAAAYPYQHVMFLSAASDREPARDIQTSDLIALPTVDNQPHGALTDTLLRVLKGDISADLDGNGKIDYAELHQTVLQFMEGREYGHTPQRLPSLAEDTKHVAMLPLFGTGIPKGGNKVAVFSTQVAVRLPAELANLKSTLEKMNGIKVVGASDQAVLELAKVSGGLELRAGSGDPIARFPDAGQELAQRLHAEAWWRNLVASARPSFNIHLETDPATQGNTFVEGDSFAFHVQTEADAHLLILNIDATGNVSVLYPQKATEQARSPARQILVLPGKSAQERIVVTPPFGLDQVVAIALPNTPSNWYGITQINAPTAIGQPAVRGIEKLLADQQGRFAWQAMGIRTYAKP